MSTSGKLAVPAQVDRHSKASTTSAAPRLVRLDALAGSQVPDMDATVAGRAGEVVLIGTQRDGPDIATACLSRGHLPPLLPLCIVAVALAAPDLDLTAETDARSDIP